MLEQHLSCKNTWKRVNVASKYNVHTLSWGLMHTHTPNQEEKRSATHTELLEPPGDRDVSHMCHQEGADSEEVRKRKEGAELLPCIVTLPLRLPSDDIHDGVL